MDIIQSFYDNLAPQYDKLFSDWESAVCEEAKILDRVFQKHGFQKSAQILDCACGIGTQAIGLAKLRYCVTASDISVGAISEGRKRAADAGVEIRFLPADFRSLSDVFAEKYDIVIAMDNALPHMLSSEDLRSAVKSITGQLKEDGMFVGSIRDYDMLLKEKPSYAPPYIYHTGEGRRVSFQTWDWNEDRYTLVQYMIDDGESLSVSRFACEYRAVRREELTNLFLEHGCRDVSWLFAEETGFYQPIVVVRK